MVKTLEYYNLTECCICLEEYEHKPASSRQAAQEANNASVTIFSTDGCGHYICQPCMQRYLQEFVNDYRNQNFFAIDCPDMECEKFYRADDIVPRAIRDPKLNNAWWRKAIERSFMEDVVRRRHMTAAVLAGSLITCILTFIVARSTVRMTVAPQCLKSTILSIKRHLASALTAIEQCAYIV